VEIQCENRLKLPVVLSFLALYGGAAPYAVAASALEVSQKPQEISGIDRDSGVAFQVLLPSNDHVVIDVSINSIQVHADIDCKLRKIQIRSFSKTSGSLQALSVQHIVAFQKLLVALPPEINTGLDTETR
jgi:hypothetical protein